MSIEFSTRISNYFYVDELAEIFNTHPETIRRWARSGKIKGERIGSKWRFAKSSIYTLKSETDAEKILGEGLTKQGYASPFDFLKDGDRIQVKATKIRTRGLRAWRFITKGTAINKKMWHYNTCDYFLLLCYDKDWKFLLKAYYIPAKIIKRDMNSTYFPILEKKTPYKKYRVF